MSFVFNFKHVDLVNVTEIDQRLDYISYVYSCSLLSVFFNKNWTFDWGFPFHKVLKLSPEIRINLQIRQSKNSYSPNRLYQMFGYYNFKYLFGLYKLVVSVTRLSCLNLVVKLYSTLPTPGRVPLSNIQEVQRCCFSKLSIFTEYTSKTLNCLNSTTR